MNRNELVAYAANFVSFLLKRKSIAQAILFGSVARGDFGKESDIDIFIETNEPKKDIQKILELYEKSEDGKKFRVGGIENPIVLKEGKLKEWPSLKRSIQADGIVLYGRYNEPPNQVKHFLQMKISLGEKKRSEKVKLWRMLYGYSQKVGNKDYISEGIIEQNKGRKIGPGVFLIPTEKGREIEYWLREKKIDFTVSDVYCES